MLDTLGLMRDAAYEQAFMFAYSQRDKTIAARTMPDDVPPDVKARSTSSSPDKRVIVSIVGASCGGVPTMMCSLCWSRSFAHTVRRTVHI